MNPFFIDRSIKTLEADPDLFIYFLRPRDSELKNPDFAALARAYGAFGERVEHTADFPEAFYKARSADCPALLELFVDPEALTPNKTLSEIREASRKSKNEITD